MDRALRPLIVAAALCAAAAPASAHHALAMFDREKTLTVTGTVKKFEWANPHVVIEVVSDRADGASMTWNIEGGAPSILIHDGWRPSMLKPGDKISLSVHPRKDGSGGGYYADERPLVINGETFPVKGLGSDAIHCN